MNLFVIGDVHGCYHTFLELLQHWQPEQELLLQVGDLMDRGNFAPETISLAISLGEKHPQQTVFLKGNHEVGMTRHYGPQGPYPSWLQWGGRYTLHQYSRHKELLAAHLSWLQQRPLFWENDAVLVSHAGLADTPNPLDEDNPDGILWRRGPLRNIGKLQVIGHTPTDGSPDFDPIHHVLNIDTGAVYGQALTGVKIKANGDVLRVISVPTNPLDSDRA
ncbi:metallophosphoesterase family protein [Hymenobacter chitinivorans]|uniref:Serine/threonine protein phosphatase 1 n=1 Tax=Hymenobacter chitinivorans DSM 11115 TaxID=1121954 RepID=A0A2M9BT68_9BACT|nr:metallophosphoesterase family protein [Hymenobacter chitinivorans]PJJ61148.1 serine/threonine protein phosphatase 1 [Hymenobacter chitinivorans DSM 11115]